MVETGTHVNVVRGCLRQYPDELLDEWLGELEELGFLESAPAAEERDLGFTAQPAKAPALLEEDRTRLERDTGRASAELSRRGAYLAEDRLRNRATARKSAADTVVLIVEDDPDQLAFADLRVTMAGYIVRVSNSARALLKTLRDHGAPDIVLLDVMLPDGDGFDILAQMRRNPTLALLPIVMLTAKDEPAEIGKGLALGADGYITKPYSKNILVETIRSVLK